MNPLFGGSTGHDKTVLGAAAPGGRSSSLGRLSPLVDKRLAHMRKKDVVARIWAKDHTVWKPEPTEIIDRLGWLTVAEDMAERMGEIEDFTAQVASEGFTRAVLLGMGGSSLAPEVLRESLGVAPGALELSVLDTTHPDAIATLEKSLDLGRTLFIVASKSGGTIETLSHLAHFHAKTGRGAQFAAITDSGSPLETLSRSHGFRHVFLNPSDIGGRFSAMSLFGLVPASLIGADLGALLHSARKMATACNRGMSGEQNPGEWMGVVMGQAARAGCDKLTLLLNGKTSSFGAWIEQLVAESTGKEGKGILPVIGEDLGGVEAYRKDRLFVAVGEHPGLDALEEAGHPIVRLFDGGPASLGGEFFRWEFATAVAGALLGVNPFDQPNVAEAKDATRRALDSERAPAPAFDELGPLLDTLQVGDYVAVPAYLDPTPETKAALQRARLAIRDRFKVATTIGFGPRFLHSTGQFHKGGPNKGVFIQVVDSARKNDVAIPGRTYTFGDLIDAQAVGDLQALRTHGRGAVRVHLQQLAQVDQEQASNERSGRARVRAQRGDGHANRNGGGARSIR